MYTCTCVLCFMVISSSGVCRSGELAYALDIIGMGDSNICTINTTCAWLILIHVMSCIRNPS